MYKEVKAEQTISSVEILKPQQRLEEIARMLAGSQITTAAREAAQSLIDDATQTESEAAANNKKPLKRTRA